MLLLTDKILILSPLLIEFTYLQPVGLARYINGKGKSLDTDCIMAKKPNSKSMKEISPLYSATQVLTAIEQIYHNQRVIKCRPWGHLM